MHILDRTCRYTAAAMESCINGDCIKLFCRTSVTSTNLSSIWATNLVTNFVEFCQFGQIR